MKANAIKYIIANTPCVLNIEVQTSNRNYYVDKQYGDSWELLEDEGMIVISNDNDTIYVDINHIVSIGI